MSDTILLESIFMIAHTRHEDIAIPLVHTHDTITTLFPIQHEPFLLSFLSFIISIQIHHNIIQCRPCLHIHFEQILPSCTYSLLPGRIDHSPAFPRQSRILVHSELIPFCLYLYRICISSPNQTTIEYYRLRILHAK